MAPETESLVDQINIAIQNQKRPTVTVLSSLLAVQDEIGYIPNEAIEQVAIKMGTSKNAVYGVASFYPNFRFTPPGDHTVEVCWGPSCHVMGAPGVLRALLSYLNLTMEGEAEDKDLTLKFNTCLGACSQAPVISINHKLTGGVDKKEALKRVKELIRKDD